MPAILSNFATMMHKKIILTMVLAAALLAVQAKDIVWYSGRGCVGYSYTGKKSAPVEMALSMFAEDMRAVTGHRAEHREGAVIEIYELDKMRDKDFRRLQRRQVPIDRIIAKPDAFAICIDSGHIVVMGSTAHGTAYGILELSRLAGVSPWTWWADVAPQRRQYLALPDNYVSIQWPTIEQRGFVAHGHGLDNHRLHELLLRLRGNTLHHADCDSPGNKCIDIMEQWLPSTQPGRIYAEMHTAYDQGARHQWMANVTNPRTVAYQLSLFMDMAWNINAVSGATLPHHLRHWLCQQLGEQVGTRLSPVLTEYYHLTGIRWPEQRGVELVADAFGNELERYLSNYNDLVQALAPITPMVPDGLHDAYMTLAEYPIRAASLMATRQLQAQEARHIGRPQSFAHDDEALASAVRSLTAHQELMTLNRTYAEMAGGKWARTIDLSHTLVAQEPTFPGKLPADAISRFAHQEPVPFLFDIGNTITRNACHYRRATAGVQPIAMLGHSMKAIQIPTGGSAWYSFYSELQGEAVIRIAAIPLQAYAGHAVSYQVCIDKGKPQTVVIGGKEGQAQWQETMKRGQAVAEFRVALSRNSHDIEIRALNAPIIIDQWMVDYDPVRSFYIFPVSPEAL